MIEVSLGHRALGDTWIKCTKEKESTNAQSAKKSSLLTKEQKNYELKHEGRPKPYQCSIGDCDIRFFNRRSLKKHEIEQHGEHVLEKKYKCTYGSCVYKTHAKQNLVQHMKACKMNLLTGRSTSVNCVERGGSICTKRCKNTRGNSIKDTNSGFTLDIWIL